MFSGGSLGVSINFKSQCWTDNEDRYLNLITMGTYELCNRSYRFQLTPADWDDANVQ